MERRQVLLVDAFADEPLAGVPVVVAPDGEWTDSQLRSVAGELGTCGAVTTDEDRLQYAERAGFHAPASAAVAGCTGLLEQGVIEPGASTLTVEHHGETSEFDVSIGADREVTITVPTQQVEDVGVSTGEIATALGVDENALADVGADLPPGRIGGFGGTLLVPVNFLQHLGSASPPTEALTRLFEETETSRAFVFTFDTLAADTNVHARIFSESEGISAGTERPASGVAAACCGAYLSHHAAFDADRERIRIESGHFLDRPATLSVTLTQTPQVSGHALITLDGQITVPQDDDDEIIEV